MERVLYNPYSVYLVKKYGEKVYKLPVNLPVSCPNRLEGKGGCTYCGGIGAGFENLSSAFSVAEQLQKNREYIGKRYKAKKFIAYFQNFTNTFLPLEQFRQYMEEAAQQQDIVELSVSTRPDCIRREYLEVLQRIQESQEIGITIELGLQSINCHTLERIERGHTLAEFIDAVLAIRQFGFGICVHMILNLPWDTMLDVIEGAKIISALGIPLVKLHALYIEKGTVLAEQYEKGAVNICSLEEYEERVITFLEYLAPSIVLERLIGRAPEENTLFSNWNTSWWKIRDEIEQKMMERNTRQGVQFHYLGGKAVNRFFDEG